MGYSYSETGSAAAKGVKGIRGEYGPLETRYALTAHGWVEVPVPFLMVSTRGRDVEFYLGRAGELEDGR